MSLKKSDEAKNLRGKSSVGVRLEMWKLLTNQTHYALILFDTISRRIFKEKRRPEEKRAPPSHWQKNCSGLESEA
jgi:hypothetical protein